jgi:recombination protein RecA
MAKGKEGQEGRLALLRKIINKRGGTTAYDLSKHNPSDVTRWIPTGSRYLDSIIACRESLNRSGSNIGGIPMGKIVELAGLESTGKSYLAWMIGANAQKMGITLVYFDSEAATDSSFIKRMGVDLKNVLYMPAVTVENVMEHVELLIKEHPEPMLFIWDSLGMTPSAKEAEGGFNPQDYFAVKARVLSVAMAKLTDPISQHGSTLLIINQLMTNIDVKNIYADPFDTPGGKKVKFAYSLRLWLIGRKALKWKITNDNGDRIGADVKVDIKKSRFGSEGRSCNFKIMWGGNRVAIADEESWFDACKFSPHLVPGAWNKLTMSDGTVESFQGAQWLEKLKDEKFRSRILEIMDETLIR